MMANIQQEHAVETFKSLIQISVEGLKLLALLNGGAAVALVAYLGNVAGKGIPLPDMRLSMGFYLSGLLLCGLAFFASYLTQLRLYNESVGRAAKNVIGRHDFYLWSGVVLAFLSLACFGVGSFLASWRFR